MFVFIWFIISAMLELLEKQNIATELNITTWPILITNQKVNRNEPAMIIEIWKDFHLNFNYSSWAEM